MINDSLDLIFFNNSPDACVIIADGNIMKFNSAFGKMFRGNPDLVLGKSFEILFPEFQPDGLRSSRFINEILGSGANAYCGPYEWVNRRMDGTELWVESTFSSSDVDGKKVVFGCYRDVSKRKLAVEKVEKVRQHYQAIIENAPDGIALISGEGNFKFVSPSARRIFGYDPIEEITANPNANTHPDDLQMVLDNLVRLLDDATYIPTIQYRFQDKQGNWKWVESTFTNLLAEPSVESIVINFRDITARKQVETALSESEEKFRELADLLPQVIFETDIDGNFVFVNRQAFKIFGYPEDFEIIGINSLNFHIPEERATARENIQQLYSGKLLKGNEYRMLRKDGSTFPGLVYSNPIIRANKPSGIRGIIVDISERKITEKRLHESEQRYRLLVETANEGILVGQGQILKFVNPMIVELSGYSRDELLSLPFLSFIHPDDWDLVLQNQANRLKGENADQRYKIRIKRKDSAIKWVEMGGVKIEWEGQPATMNFITDITDRKKAEEEIILQNEKLLRANVEKDKFFSIISHDIRSPFSGFLGLTQIMAEDLPSLTMQEIQEIAVSMRNSATNLFRLLENLLQWSLIQQGLIPFIPVRSSLFQIAEESNSSILEPARRKEIEIVNRIEENIIAIADHQLLQTIFRNLMSNAVKFTPKGGRIILSATFEGENIVQIAIQDNGIGISPDMVDKLFRLDVQTGRKGTEGEVSSGLGLVLCKEFVERHGGKLWVESTEGEGSIFYFTLPTVEDFLI